MLRALHSNLFACSKKIKKGDPIERLAVSQRPPHATGLAGFGVSKTTPRSFTLTDVPGGLKRLKTFHCS